ncbi:hypothetical protein D3C84_867050 [compost metagenome]
MLVVKQAGFASHHVMLCTGVMHAIFTEVRFEPLAEAALIRFANDGLAVAPEVQVIGCQVLVECRDQAGIVDYRGE